MSDHPHGPQSAPRSNRRPGLNAIRRASVAQKREGLCCARIEAECSERRGEYCRAKSKFIGRYGHPLCGMHRTASGIGV